MEFLSKAFKRGKSVSFLTYTVQMELLVVAQVLRRLDDFLTHTVQMEPVKFLTKIKIAETLFNSQVVKTL
jgi:uncharacterized membrane-anchored protein